MKRFKKNPLVLAAAFFSLFIVFAWAFAMRQYDRSVAVIGAIYAGLCFSFLVTQISAFVKAHLDYDQSIEEPKYSILLNEEKEWRHL